MGLQYSHFLIHTPCEELAKKIKAEVFVVDESEFLEKERNDFAKYCEAFDIASNKMDIKGIEDYMNNDPLAKEVTEYRNRTEGKMQVTLLAVPNNPEWTFGYYMCPDPWIKRLEYVYNYMMSFYPAMFLQYSDAVWFINYHHGSNDGTVLKCNLDENHHLKYTPIKYAKGECERFHVFAKRVQKTEKAPIWDMHDFMLNIKLTVDWKYHFRFEVPKVSKDWLIKNGVQLEEKV